VLVLLEVFGWICVYSDYMYGLLAASAVGLASGSRDSTVAVWLIEATP
jgi:hypothetical protein